MIRVSPKELSRVKNELRRRIAYAQDKANDTFGPVSRANKTEADAMRVALGIVKDHARLLAYLESVAPELLAEFESGVVA